MPPDWELSGWITDLYGNSAFLDELMKVLASNYFAPKVVVLIGLFIWFGTRGSVHRERNQKVIVGVAVGTMLGFLIAESLCLFQDHVGDFWTRPYDNERIPQAYEAMNALYFPLSDSSFPSNAMCGLAAIAAGIGYATRRAAVVIWVLVILWALGRMYVGVHYPIDIAGGILIGCAAAFVGRKLALAFDPAVPSLLRCARRFYLA